MLYKTSRDNRDRDFELIDVDMNEFADPSGIIGILEDAAKEGAGESRQKRFAREFASYLIIVVSALLIALALNRFVIINAHIPSSSMVPTLRVDDRLIGFRLAYIFKEPCRGDVVIFKHSFSDTQEAEVLVKRVIGIPGDVVRIDSGGVYINGNLLKEDYLAEDMNVLSAAEYVVPAGSYFMMGDNRNVSYDSRMWKNTFVTKDEIIAEVMIRYYPKLEIIR